MTATTAFLLGIETLEHRVDSMESTCKRIHGE